MPSATAAPVRRTLLPPLTDGALNDLLPLYVAMQDCAAAGARLLAELPRRR